MRRDMCLWVAITLAIWSAAPQAEAYEVDKEHQRISVTSVADFEHCQNDYSYADLCFDALKRYVDKHPKEQFGVGKVVRARFNHWVALQFFVPALKAATPAQCEDEDLALAVVSGMALPEDDPNLALARKALESSCREPLLRAVRSGLKDGSTLYLKNACKALGSAGVAVAACGPARAP